MSISASIVIDRPASDVFAIYKDVDSWARWDPDVEAVALHGPFASGTRGWLKPVGAPKTKTMMTQVEEDRSFTVESRLPLCRMIFLHDLIETADGTAVTHTVLFEGLLAPVFSRLIGKKIRSGIDATMQGLKTYAEQH